MWQQIDKLTKRDLVANQDCILFRDNEEENERVNRIDKVNKGTPTLFFNMDFIF